MASGEEQVEAQRTVLARRAFKARGIGFTFAREDIGRPTDWRIASDDHVFVIHRAGRLNRMETVFENGPAAHVLPEVGDTWIIPAGARYAALARGGTVDYCEVAIPAALLGDRAPFARLAVRDPFLHHAAERMAAIDPDDALSLLLSDTLAEGIRLHVMQTIGVRRAQRKRSLAPAARRALVDRIEAAPDAPHTLAELAGVAQMGVHEFLAAFRTAFGMSPHQYVIRRRIDRAKRLLADTRESVTEIALSVGFSTPSHFSAAFRAHTGLSPRDWRRAAASA